MVTRITADAPVRVCDAGGWTDTWFAREGLVCSVAVTPGARVVVELGDATGPTTLALESTGERYLLTHESAALRRHPLLEAAIAHYPPPEGRAALVQIGAAVPPGSGTGTSASVVVALLSALRAARGEACDPTGLAHDAHAIEIGQGLQSGVQDQYAAAHGGCNTIRIGPYPQASVQRLDIGDDVIDALDARLITVYLGAPHDSSRVHEEVITDLERDGRAELRLQPLRDAALAAADALGSGDLDRYGAALVDNTRAQAALHPGLVSSAAHALTELAQRHGACGWKVNGAGGDGGSVTIVGSPDATARQAMIDDIDRVVEWRRLALRFAHRGAQATLTE